MILALAGRIRRGMTMLQSAQDGDRGVVEIASCGADAIPALRRFVLRRESSGLYQARCRAVEALAALNARDAILEVLQLPLSCPDPVERTGDEAVVNAAARALGGSHDDAVFAILLDLARHRHLTGVIESLGRFGRPEAIPRLVDALLEDCSRPAAETALQRFGKTAYRPLLEIAVHPHHRGSELRQRRGALRVLRNIGAPMSAALNELSRSAADLELRVIASECILAAGNAREQREAVWRLIDLATDAGWRLQIDVEHELASRPDVTVGVIEDRMAGETNPDIIETMNRLLHHLTAKSKSPP